MTIANSAGCLHSSFQYGEIPSKNFVNANTAASHSCQKKHFCKKRKILVPRNRRRQSSKQMGLVSAPNEYSCQSSSDESEMKSNCRQHKIKQNALEKTEQKIFTKKSGSFEILRNSNESKQRKNNRKLILPKKAFSKPFPRSAPHASGNVGTDFCSTDSGCNESDCGPEDVSPSDYSGKEVSFMRTMKAKMIKLEDTLDLMYRKFRLHEDNIDEIQVYS